jgi:hypothetical protein
MHLVTGHGGVKNDKRNGLSGGPILRDGSHRPRWFGVALMCINPNLLPSGETVACRKCWQCRENRINDWAGRCIAESKTALATYAITLTYGENTQGDVIHERTAVLTYSDVQKYLKLLRFNGFRFKYFAVGEYGSKKGRAHWHLIVFFKGEVPEHEHGKRFHEKHWPHGFSFWEKVNQERISAVRYICKYVHKDLDDALRQGHLAMSKKPPIGSEYFAGLAQRHVEAGLSPADLSYSFAGVVNPQGEKIKFMLPRHSRSADTYILEFVTRWEKQRPGQFWPHSDIVEHFEDKWVREAQGSAVVLERAWWRKAPPNKTLPKGCSKPFFDKELRMYVFKNPAGDQFYWFPTGEWNPQNKTVMSWQRKDGLQAEAIKRRAAEIHTFMGQLRSQAASTKS